MAWNIFSMRRMPVAVLLTVTFGTAADLVKEDSRSVVCRQPDHEIVTVPKHPERVIVAYGSLAKVWALAGGTAVGVPALSEKNVLPESMRDLPSIGSATAPNVEKVLAMKPDLVLLIAKLERQCAAGKLLRRTGVNALCVDYSNYGDFYRLLDLFCRINGKKIPDLAQAKQVTDEVARICSRAKSRTAPRCAVLFASSAGFSLESHRTNTGMMLEMLGGINILKTKGYARVRFSYEQLILENPDVILLITMGDSEALRKKFRRDFMDQPAWNRLKAAKNQRVHFLPAELFLYMPGPDYPKAFRHLSDLLYPEERGGRP